MRDRVNEKTKVEDPFLSQLKDRLGWNILEGDIDVPYLTERESFKQVLLRERLKQALRRINLDPSGQPWLDDQRLEQAMAKLERLGARSLIEANQVATSLLLGATPTTVAGRPDWDGGRDQTIQFIDFDHPDRNDFVAVRQFRVDPPWAVSDRDFVVPDIVLFVNGIPLVVIECKSPNITNPMEEGITQLRRYANQREEVEGDEGAERLFYYNQFTVSTWNFEARAGTITSSYDHYLEWKDTSPQPLAGIAKELGVTELTSQQMLVAGMLRKEHLLDIVRNFTLFQEEEGRTIKIIPRYQQFRAVHEAIRRLRTGKTREEHGSQDQRGGIIWHTQGSGKSLTMVFLVRKMRTLADLRRFKIVVVTDRKALEKQLGDTAALTGETVRKARTSSALRTILAQKGPDLVFAMIQKYLSKDESEQVLEFGGGEGGKGAAQRLRVAADYAKFGKVNDSPDILCLVDEAHRSHASQLHANLLNAMPNCAKIGFTGTPIIRADKKRTQDIFGSFIDRYTIRQSQDDGATVPIIYEGRTAKGAVADGKSLDRLFEDMFQDKTDQELLAIKRRYATTGNVLEAPKMIAEKARDILRHYVRTALPDGFKAQIVATSRLAAIRYQATLADEHKKLLAEAEKPLPASLRDIDDEELAKRDPDMQVRVQAHRHLARLRRMEFAAIISGEHNDDPGWKEWTEKGKQDARISRFKKPFEHKDREKCDGLAFLCVKSMLLVGFDAPIEQVLYIDRRLRHHELLQAIARVNRKYRTKARGLVVDYIGVGHHLKEALDAYDAADIQGALTDIKEELPKLRDRHQRVLSIFIDKGIKKIDQIEDCVLLLRDTKIRAHFALRFKQFLESVDLIMPRPEVLPFLRDAKILGFINQAAANLYRDSRLNLMGVAAKVRHLIDTHVVAKGIDPKVPPISILDTTFKKALERHRSRKTKAAEMEHAIRHHIERHFPEDPAYYKSLSEKLERILKQFKQDWDELIAALDKVVTEVRQGRPQDDSGLDPKTQAPFLGVLLEELERRESRRGQTRRPDYHSVVAEAPSKLSLEKLAKVTVELVAHIRQEIRVVDFWRNLHAQKVLRSTIVRFLDDAGVFDGRSFGDLERIADRLVELARARHTSLVA